MGEVIVPALLGFGAATAASSLTKKPQVTKPPPVPAVQAPPATVDTTEAGEQVRKQPTSGRADTFITGDLVPKPKKKTVLG